MEQSNKHFIRTSDENVIAELRKHGFREVGMQGKAVCFLNQPGMTFSQEDLGKMTFTNALSL